jgi:hypothetical protein
MNERMSRINSRIVLSIGHSGADGELGAFRHVHRGVRIRGSQRKGLVRDSATGGTRAVSTNADRLYSVPSLQPETVW